MPRPLPADWRPRELVEAQIKALGFDVAGVLRLYHEDKQGFVLKRWGERTFLSWFEIARTASRLPRDQRG